MMLMQSLQDNKERSQLIRKFSAPLLLLLLIVVNVVITPNFFRINNLNNIITQLTPTLLTGMGMTLVISTGGIDISVGSVMALAGVTTATLMPTMGLVPAILISVLASIAVGIITGIMVGKLRLQAMVVTLGLMLGVRGIAQVITDGRDLYFNRLGDAGTWLTSLGNYKIGGIVPIQIIPIVISIAFVWIVVEKTMLGRQIQAVGDNPKSSTLSGISTAKTMMIVYGLSAIFAASAGIFQAARVSVASGSSLGQLAELDAIAAVAIGGTPMSGGKANVLGTVIGALIMQVITLTCVMNNIPEQYAQIIKAIILALAVFIQRKKAH